MGLVVVVVMWDDEVGLVGILLLVFYDVWVGCTSWDGVGPLSRLGWPIIYYDSKV